MIGKHVIVRSYSAGVFAGTVVSIEPSGDGRSCVVLNGSRRLWKWAAKSGVALSGVAVHGVNASRSTIDESVDGHLINDVIEVLPTTTTAQETFR